MLREKNVIHLLGFVDTFTNSTHLEREVEPLLTVPLIVQVLLQPEDAALLLLVTDHVELLLRVSSYNAEGQLGVFSSVSVLC